MAKAPETASTRLIYGFHAISAKLRHAPDAVLEIHLSGDRKDARVKKFIAQAEAAGTRMLNSDSDKLDALVGTRRHQGVVAKVDATRREIKLADVLDSLEENALILVLDGVQDPHNLGACLRSAAAAAVTAVVIPRDKAVQLTATVRKTSAGAADRVPVFAVANLARTLKALQQAGVWIYGLAGEAGDSLYAQDLRGNVALVLGGEGEGLRRLTREHCDALVRIPMPGAMESLNVSVSAGIALFEAVRQRQA